MHMQVHVIHIIQPILWPDLQVLKQPISALHYITSRAGGIASACNPAKCLQSAAPLGY